MKQMSVLELYGTEFEVVDETARNSGYIPAVTKLPDTASEGDIVLYCPSANELTLADSGNTVFFDFDEMERFLVDCIENSETLIAQGFVIDSSSFAVVYVPEAEGNGFVGEVSYTDFGGTTHSRIWTLENEQLREFTEQEYAEWGIMRLSSDFLEFPEFESIGDAVEGNTKVLKQYNVFQAKPRKYRFSNGAWRLLPEVENLVTTETFNSAITELKGDVDEIEALIDESGVLDE